ncbi:PHD finger protein 20b isoform X1 [Salmo trutta]|uniref:PHD finger protein 20b isoform X1 n=1 Tax=Salmo trutta TaxID=8032 RepID=UPI001130B44A|nr:PHD finger protein 20-like isoform X1 [Salmo trutta]
MTKTPPDRRGITFEVGAQLEARDNLKNWYQASIEKIDYEDEKVLIHYRQWSHRYDEWFDWTSPYLRPLDRIQLRRAGLQDKRPSPVFRVNEKVLACWVDCRYYPAKVLEVKRDASYTVKFFDGVVKTLKATKVKPYKKENGKARERDRTQSEQSSGKEENGKVLSDESKSGSSDLDGESNGEEKERREDGEEKTLNGNFETCGQKGNLNGEEGEKGAGGGKREGPQAKENGQVVQTKKEDVNVEGERVMRSTKQQGKTKEECASGQSPQQPRGNRYRPSEESQRELRKRRVSLVQMPPPKRRRPDTSKDRNSQSQQAGSDSVPASPALTPDQTNTQTPTDAGIEAPSDIESILKRQVHLPTTHKYSREPLYRVIKNQPPPILSIELDHNPFKCKAPGCLKSFRKASLLHYHVKYYHADSEHASECSMQTRASEKQVGSQETPRRRRTMSGSIHSPLGDRQAANGMNRHRRRSLSEKRKENQQINSRPHEEREWSASETGEKIREKTERDFILNKQKKMKKTGRSKSENTNGEENIGISLLNSTQSNPNLVSKFSLLHKHKLSYDSSPEHITDQVQEDDESDWSTVSAEWSDGYMEAELDVTTPMSEQNVSMVTKGSDMVRCVCEVEEENDFMIQCDECLCWQHGTCMGLFEHNVPDTYNCYICRDPPAQRPSQRYWYDRDWLSSGHMYGLSFLDENYSHQNRKKLTATHQLLGDVHHVYEVLNGLQLKMSILQTQTHSDLKLWRQPWKQEEELGMSRSMATSRAPSPAANDREVGDALKAMSVSAPSGKAKRVQMSPTSFQDSNASYISSEHCYQKPRAYYPAVEQRLVVETRGGSELEDSLRSTENLLELEQRYGGPLDPDRAKLYPSSLLQDRAKIHPVTLQPDKGLDLYKKLYVGWESEVKTEEAEPSPDIKPDPEKDNVLHHQWQINLLDHIEAMQNQVTHRMDLIEKELDVLESWLDYTGELEPPDPLTRLPQLKHRIRQMLTDLGTVQQISLCSSKT